MVPSCDVHVRPPGRDLISHGSCRLAWLRPPLRALASQPPQHQPLTCHTRHRLSQLRSWQVWKRRACRQQPCSLHAGPTERPPGAGSVTANHRRMRMWPRRHAPATEFAFRRPTYDAWCDSPRSFRRSQGFRQSLARLRSPRLRAHARRMEVLHEWVREGSVRRVRAGNRVEARSHTCLGPRHDRESSTQTL